MAQATGTSIFTIGANPNIQTVTSSSAYLQPAGNPPVAPYDVVSIFGTNLCSSCVGPNATMFGSPQTSNLAYPTSLSNTDANSVTRKLQVAFQTHASTTTPSTSAGPSIPGSPVYAPLLFATNNQINLLVPSAVSAAIASGNHLVDVVVSFGTAASPALSNLFPVSVVSSDPGIFTIGADGQGNGAILDKTWAVVGESNPAAMHSTPIADQFSIYMTGLGAPTSSADDSATGSYAWSGDCIALTGSSPEGYAAALGNLTGITPLTLDGLVIQSSLINTGRFAPCLSSTTQAPTSLTIGGVPATVKYAGWVADSIAGLYQVNVTMPSTVGTYYTTTADCKNFSGSFSNITTAVQLPVCYMSHDGTTVSQPGVTMWVAPRLTVTAPVAASGSPLTLTEKVGAPFTASLGASEGSGSGYTYTLASGTLPAGVSLSTGGVISGTPALGTVGPYPITVEATDTSVPPLTGTVSFTIAVGNGLFVNSTVLTTGVSVATGPATTWSGAITQIGGTPTITYSVQSGNLPAGLTLNPDGTVTGQASNPASGVVVVFQATDANGWSGTVSVTFNIT